MGGYAQSAQMQAAQMHMLWQQHFAMQAMLWNQQPGVGQPWAQPRMHMPLAQGPPPAPGMPVPPTAWLPPPHFPPPPQ
jgi:hypothetical protein